MCSCCFHQLPTFYFTHTHIQTHRCVSVSRNQFYNQFGLGGGVGWCSLQQSDCCSYSASRAINFISLTTGELGVVKDMSWARVQTGSTSFHPSLREGYTSYHMSPGRFPFWLCALFMSQCWWTIAEIVMIFFLKSHSYNSNHRFTSLQ